MALPLADMPHGMDISDDPNTASIYECLRCGDIVESESHPGPCNCGGEFQNRAKSLE